MAWLFRTDAKADAGGGLCCVAHFRLTAPVPWAQPTQVRKRRLPVHHLPTLRCRPRVRVHENPVPNITHPSRNPSCAVSLSVLFLGTVFGKVLVLKFKPLG